VRNPEHKKYLDELASAWTMLAIRRKLQLRSEEKRAAELADAGVG
jgi:hypothetical protein